MKKIILIGIFVFIFIGCGSSDGSGVQYQTGDMVIITKNIHKSLIPYYKTNIKKLLEERFEGLPVDFEIKDYESESCTSFGFKFKDIETKKNYIQTNFTKSDKTTCIIQDHAIGDESYRGNGGLVIFMRLK